MAKAKQTTAPAEVKEELNVNETNEVVAENNVNPEATESEGTVVSHIEEVSEPEQASEPINESVSTESEVGNETVEEAESETKENESTDYVAPTTEIKDEEPDSKNEDKPLDITALRKEFANPAAKIDELNLTEENKEQVVKEELSRVNDIEKELSEDIKKSEEALPKKARNLVSRMYSDFGEFWNGVTETI